MIVFNPLMEYSQDLGRTYSNDSWNDYSSSTQLSSKVWLMHGLIIIKTQNSIVAMSDHKICD